MQIVPVTSNPIPPRSTALERPAPVRGADRVNELLSHTRTYQSGERVLQGELLQGGREPDQAVRPRPQLYDSRREDHPAFYQRHANREYIQRQAMAAYQMHVNSEAPATAGRGIDYFV